MTKTNLIKDIKPDIENSLNIWSKVIKPEENGYYWKKTPIITKGPQLDSNKPIVVELFSGCGGTSLGFEMAGYQIAIGCDIHQPSVLTFKRNHPLTTTIMGDVKRVQPETIRRLLGGRRIDVLIAGVPCQGFSLNNRKRHATDERNMLYREFVRFIEVLNPKAILLENVSGMGSTGNFVENIEKDLSRASNTIVKSKLLFAPDYGVPQKRNRLVFIGIEGKAFDFDKIHKTHGPSTGRDYVTVKEAIGDLPSLKKGEVAQYYNKEPFCDYQRLMRAKSGKILTNHQAPNHPASTVERINRTLPGEPMYPKYKQRIRLAWDGLSPTQVSGGIRPQFQFGHPEDARGLTIRERCRLQSFPDDFHVHGGITQGRVQTGNAVPPLLAKAIAISILEQSS